MPRFSNKLRTRRLRGVEQRESVVRIEPNEPCPCGSGLKYKRCCRAAKGLTGWWRRRQVLKAKVKALVGPPAGPSQSG